MELRRVGEGSCARRRSTGAGRADGRQDPLGRLEPDAAEAERSRHLGGVDAQRASQCGVVEIDGTPELGGIERHVAHRRAGHDRVLQRGLAEVGVLEAGTGERGAVERCLAQLGPLKDGAGEVGTLGSGAAQVGPDEACPIEVCRPKVGLAEACSIEDRPGHDCGGQVHPSAAGLRQVGLGEVGPGQVGFLK